MSSAEYLRRIALEEFARVGYAGSSLHHIAELAGLSKSSVLYHYASKEALLAAAVQPALDRLNGVLELVAGGVDDSTLPAFIEAFVDFLLAHRLEVHLFINQGPSLLHLDVARRADELVQRFTKTFRSVTDSLEDRIRLGVALGGAAFFLADRHMRHESDADESEVRRGLIATVGELLSPRLTRPEN